MTLGSIQRPQLADEVTERLREAIVSGQWPLQERIPPEPELMAQLGVSRGTLREGVKALAHAGMLEVRRGDGTYVRAAGEIHGAARKAYREHEDEDVLQVRFALDTKAAHLAARLANDGDIAAMRAMLAKRREAWAAEDLERWIAADWDFHLKVAESSGNRLLHELYGSFGDAFHGTKMAQRLRNGFDGCLEAGHEALVSAIAARDEDAAVATVNANLNYCMSWMPQAGE